MSNGGTPRDKHARAPRGRTANRITDENWKSNVSYGTLVVNSWVAIHEGCDMTYNVSGSNDMCVAVSSRTHLPFEFYFQGDALRQFIELGRKALAEMDALVTQEEAEQDAHIPATLER